LINETSKTRDYQRVINEVNQSSTSVRDLIAEAKEMEKEQMIDAHIEGQRVFDNYQHTQWTTDQAEQYYKETYGE